MQVRQAVKQINLYQISAVAALALFFTLVHAQPSQAFFVNIKPAPFQQALGVALSKEYHEAQNIEPAATNTQEPLSYEPAPELLDLSDMIESLAWLSLPEFSDYSF